MLVGFGTQSFGVDPFGQDSWSTSVFYKRLPEEIRLEDERNGFFLKKLFDSFSISLQDSRTAIAQLSGVSFPLTTDAANLNSYITLGKRKDIFLTNISEGYDGSVTSTGVFSSKSIRFTKDSIGFFIKFVGRSQNNNENFYKILTVTSSESCILEGSFIAETGPIRWQLYEKPTVENSNFYEVKGLNSLFCKQGMTLFDGFKRTDITDKKVFYGSEHISIQEKNATIDSSGRIKGSKFSQLSSDNIGDLLFLSKSAINQNAFYVIEDIDEISSSDKRIVVSRQIIKGASSPGTIQIEFKNEATTNFIHLLITGINMPLSHVIDNNEITINLATDTNGESNTTALQLQTYIQSNVDLDAEIESFIFSGGLGIVQPFQDFSGHQHKFLEELSTLQIHIFKPILVKLDEFEGVNSFVIKFGNDLETISSNTVRSFKANFTQEDIGKTLVIYDKTNVNNRIFTKIAMIISPNQCTIEDSCLVSGATNLQWYLKSTTDFNSLFVNINKPDTLSILYDDLFLPNDPDLPELFRRDFLRNIPSWISKKGVLDSYFAILRSHGCTGEITPLYRTEFSLASLLGDNLLIIGDENEGKKGLTGVITVHTNSHIIFTDPTAKFSSQDVGNYISILNADEPSNNTLHKIEAIISETTVQFPLNTIAVPDSNNEDLDWQLVKTFSKLSPLIPNVDDVNMDLMITIQGASNFSADMFCWEPTFTMEIPITVTTVTKISNNFYQITATGQIDVVSRIGRWFIKQGSNDDLYLESQPVDLGGSTFSFHIYSKTTPSTGAYSLDYNCPENPVCFLCKTNSIFINITAEEIANFGFIAISNLLKRINAKFEVQKPAKVNLFYGQTYSMPVILPLAVEIEV